MAGTKRINSDLLIDGKIRTQGGSITEILLANGDVLINNSIVWEANSDWNAVGNQTEVLNKPITVSQAEAEAGTSTTPRMWTAVRVKQAVDINVSTFVIEPIFDGEWIRKKVGTTYSWVTSPVVDMTRAVYDVNNSGIVDDAELVNGLSVQTAVPLGALFTDSLANLSYIPSPSSGTIANTTGTNAVIPLVNSTDAGLVTSTDKIKIDGALQSETDPIWMSEEANVPRLNAPNNYIGVNTFAQVTLGVYPTADDHLATKLYVDDKSVNFLNIDVNGGLWESIGFVGAIRTGLTANVWYDIASVTGVDNTITTVLLYLLQTGTTFVTRSDVKFTANINVSVTDNTANTITLRTHDINNRGKDTWISKIRLVQDTADLTRFVWQVQYDASASSIGVTYNILHFGRKGYSTTGTSIDNVLSTLTPAFSSVELDDPQNVFWLEPIGYLGSGGSGATNLAYTPSPTNGIVTSSTGTDATISTVDATNAGLTLPGDKVNWDTAFGWGDHAFESYAFTATSNIFKGINSFDNIITFGRDSSNDAMIQFSKISDTIYEIKSIFSVNLRFNFSNRVTFTGGISASGGSSAIFDLEMLGSNTRFTKTTAEIDTYGVTGIVNSRWVKDKFAQLAIANVFTLDQTATDWIITSDITLKENIIPLSPDELLIQYKEYNFKDPKKDRTRKRYGVIAQEVEKLYPEFVTTSPKGIKAVSYNDLLIREVAYLKDQNKALRHENDLIIADIAIIKEILNLQ